MSCTAMRPFKALRLRSRNADSEEESCEGTWIGFLEFLRPMLPDLGDLPTMLSIRESFRWRRTYRANRLLPVSRVEVSRDSWEICLHVPGLLRQNPIGTEALSLAELVSQLDAAMEGGDHLRLVVSDEREMTVPELERLATQPGNEWVGSSLDGLDASDLRARFDFPVGLVEVKASHDRSTIALVVRG